MKIARITVVWVALSVALARGSGFETPKSESPEAEPPVPIEAPPVPRVPDAREAAQLDLDLGFAIAAAGSEARGRRVLTEICVVRGRRWRALEADARAQYLWGLCALTGWGVPAGPDHSDAHDRFLAAAKMGLPIAETQVGIDYQQGIGVPVRYDWARRWYVQAASHGSPHAFNQLGGVYLQGIGVAPDWRRAYQYFLEAANRGLDMSQTALGEMLVQSGDVLAGCRWFARAAAQGDEVGVKRLTDCRRAGIGSGAGPTGVPRPTPPWMLTPQDYARSWDRIRREQERQRVRDSDRENYYREVEQRERERRSREPYEQD